jgi:hypothetical protein
VSEAALHDPALTAQTGAVWGTAFGDDWLDTARPELLAVLLEVVPTVGQEPVGLLAWAPGLAAHRLCGKIIKERDELRDVVTVPACQRDAQRDAA